MLDTFNRAPPTFTKQKLSFCQKGLFYLSKSMSPQSWLQMVSQLLLCFTDVFAKPMLSCRRGALFRSLTLKIDLRKACNSRITHFGLFHFLDLVLRFADVIAQSRIRICICNLQVFLKVQNTMRLCTFPISILEIHATVG